MIRRGLHGIYMQAWGLRGIDFSSTLCRVHFSVPQPGLRGNWKWEIPLRVLGVAFEPSVKFYFLFNMTLTLHFLASRYAIMQFLTLTSNLISLHHTTALHTLFCKAIFFWWSTLGIWRPLSMCFRRPVNKPWWWGAYGSFSPVLC